MLRGIAKDGHEGEWLGLSVIKKMFKSDGAVMQADWIFPFNDDWYLVEVKHQEVFVPPPFYGHGLPRWQVNARLKFYEETGIRPILMVIEKPMKGVYFQYLDKLDESGDYFDTRGRHPRRVYNLDQFVNATEQARDLGLIKK